MPVFQTLTCLAELRIPKADTAPSTEAVAGSMGETVSVSALSSLGSNPS